MPGRTRCRTGTEPGRCPARVDLRVTFHGQAPITFLEYEGSTFYGGNVVETRLTFAEPVDGPSPRLTFTQNDISLECPRS